MAEIQMPDWIQMWYFDGWSKEEGLLLKLLVQRILFKVSGVRVWPEDQQDPG